MFECSVKGVNDARGRDRVRLDIVDGSDRGRDGIVSERRPAGDDRHGQGEGEKRSDGGHGRDPG
jgi:hypothetical protein